MNADALESGRSCQPSLRSAPRRFRLALLLIALVALLAACGTAPPLPRDRYYALEPDGSAPTAGQLVAAILQVNDLAARGFLGGRQILYRTQEQPLVVERYETYLWEVPAPRALAAILVETIRDVGLFRHVVIPADRAKPDLLLGGEVERFEHRPTERPPLVLAKLNLSLVRTNDRRSLWTRQYSGQEPVSADTPDAMAEAFNRLARRLALEVTRDLVALGTKLESTARP
ncbi:hypothetical protein G3446_13075 [Thiorhodococcus minor]|uniref:ABC-type transport auxiliary lipoprotein component domain-containing protein n=1 Tax=Thiorhodococcus minor TaxID=57489 RepID=A0A6M0K0F2_9GAMM|nr:hypothetical protein [Thiorhodococcus minor]